MKNLIYTTVAAIALTTASAGAQDQLRETVDNILESNGFVVDAWSLPEDVVAEIYAMEGADSTMEGGGVQQIEAILADAGYKPMEMDDDTTIYYMFDTGMGADFGANSLRDLVELKLSEFGFQVEGDSLSDDQVAELFAIVQSTEGEPSQERIEMVLQ